MCNRMQMDDVDARPKKVARLQCPEATLHGESCVDVMKRMPDDQCALVLADPPYEGVVSAEWDVVQDYVAFSRNWLREAVRVLRPGGALLVDGSPERNWIARLSVMLEDEFGQSVRLVRQLSWVYNQGGGSRVSSMKKYTVQHELLLWFEKVGGERTFNACDGVEHYRDDERAVALSNGKGRVSDQLLDRGRPPRSFLDFSRENSRSKERAYGFHPSMKPLGLCEHLVKLHSSKGDRVFVPFAGSGSEMLAAAKLSRVTVGAEINGEYIDLVCRRFEGHGARLVVQRTTG